MKRIRTLFLQELPFFTAMPAILWQLLFLLIPLGIIFFYSFHISIADYTGYLTPSLASYKALLQPVYLAIVVRSGFFAFLTALSALLLAYPVAYFLAMRVRRWKNFFLFLLTLPFWTNFLVQIYAWYFIIEPDGLINTILKKMGIITEPIMLANSLGAVFLVMLYCYLPFMIMPLYTALEKIDKRLLEASADLGARPWQTFAQITLPLSYQGIKTGFLLVLVPAFGEFAIPELIGGSKYMFVGSLISYYFLVARNTFLGAAFTVSCGLLLFLFIYLMRRLIVAFFLVHKEVD